jgi:hypothetical protein
MDRHRPSSMQSSRFNTKVIHAKLVTWESQATKQYTGGSLIVPRPLIHSRNSLNRPPRLHIHNGERVSWRDQSTRCTEADHSSWAPFIGLLVVVVFCAAAWILAPKGENQTYVHPMSFLRANLRPCRQLLAYQHALPPRDPVIQISIMQCGI